MPETEVAPSRPRILCCIINWNGLNDTVECLESVLELDYPSYDILVVDNGSVHDEADAIRRRFGNRVVALRSPRNEGFAGGANQGISYAKERGYEYILILNNDCTVAPDLLSELEQTFASASNVAVVGPAVCYHDERDVVSSAGVMFRMCMASARRLGVGLSLDKLPKTPYDVDFVDGSCMLVSIAAINSVGPLDPIFFVYWEETDWCVRFRQRGLRVLCAPSTKVWHKRWRSAGGFYSELYLYAYLRNQLLFMRRNSRKFCTFPRCLAYVHLALASLASSVLHRRTEGPTVLMRLIWLLFHAVIWNLGDSPEDLVLSGLVRLRERALVGSA